jgi:hypothetical protein
MIELKGQKLHFLKRNVIVAVEQEIVREQDLIRIFKLEKSIYSHGNSISLEQLLSPVVGGTLVLSRLDERLQSYNDVAINLEIPEIKEDIQKLLSDCNYLVESLGEDVLKSRIKEHLIDWDTLYCIIEKYF